MIRDWKRANPIFATFPESRRKLEWQAQDTASLWDTVMHFRPSGIRAKAPTYLPALVAITQTSVIGSRRRRLTPHEAARLQGFSRTLSFTGQRDSASYKQVGNGVAVGAAWHVFRTHVERDASDLPRRLVRAVLNAPLNPTGDALANEAMIHEAKERCSHADCGQLSEVSCRAAFLPFTRVTYSSHRLSSRFPAVMRAGTTLSECAPRQPIRCSSCPPPRSRRP